MIHATARDWAKFGEFLRNGGAVRGAQLVPRGWVDFMRTPSPRNPRYGAQLWLNRPADDRHDVLFADRGPNSLFACVGHLGQFVLVSPRQKLTVVRLGKTDEPDRANLRRRLADIVALFPRR
jgi:CubicO group peptidase (beta-lactamase class C family)